MGHGKSLIENKSSISCKTCQNIENEIWMKFTYLADTNNDNITKFDLLNDISRKHWMNFANSPF